MSTPKHPLHSIKPWAVVSNPGTTDERLEGAFNEYANAYERMRKIERTGLPVDLMKRDQVSGLYSTEF